jgi:hypothetical protein
MFIDEYLGAIPVKKNIFSNIRHAFLVVQQSSKYKQLKISHSYLVAVKVIGYKILYLSGHVNIR